MRPLGDLDDDELALGPADAASEAGSVDIPPALPGLRRRLLLARLGLEWGSPPGTGPPLPGQAAAPSRALAPVLPQGARGGGALAHSAPPPPAENSQGSRL